MSRFVLVSLFSAFLAGCTTTGNEPFDPSVDARIGEEVTRACYSSTTDRFGGPDDIGDYTTAVVGSRTDLYLLVFSSGCNNIRNGGASPVFRNRGDNCRRRGELIETFNQLGVSGACTIKRIYRWNEDAEKNEEEG